MSRLCSAGGSFYFTHLEFIFKDIDTWILCVFNVQTIYSSLISQIVISNTVDSTWMP